MAYYYSSTDPQMDCYTTHWGGVITEFDATFTCHDWFFGVSFELLSILNYAVSLRIFINLNYVVSMNKCQFESDCIERIHAMPQIRFTLSDTDLKSRSLATFSERTWSTSLNIRLVRRTVQCKTKKKSRQNSEISPPDFRTFISAYPLQVHM